MTGKQPKNSGKAPSIQFYYKDWLEDQRLKRASKKAKGVWIDLIANSCGMPVPGVFADGNDGKTPLKRREINGLLTGNRRENREGITELINRGILKRREDGAFYVKRIYEDMKLRRLRQEAGRKGGNPNLLNQNSNQTPTPSTSTSTSVTNIHTHKGEQKTLLNQNPINPTLQDVMDIAPVIGIPDDKAQAWYEHFHPQGFVFGNGLPIVDLRGALVRWRNNQFKFDRSVKNANSRDINTTPGRDFDRQNSQFGETIDV